MKKICVFLFVPGLLLMAMFSLSFAEEMITNGAFDDDYAWTVYDVSGNATAEAIFGVDNEYAPKFGDGPYLELRGEGTYSNILVWQDLVLIGGQTYEFSGAFKDLTEGALENFWCEIYLSTEEPVDLTDWTPPGGANTDRITGFNTWDGCGPGVDGTFQDDGCEPPNTRYYTAPGDAGEPVTVYFGVKAGVWTDQQALFFDVAVDEVSLVEEGALVDKRKQSTVDQFILFPNYPNPFNPTTAIDFATSKTGMANLAVFDVNGRKVKTLLHRNLPRGRHSVIWDATDEQGQAVPSGLYFAKLQSGDELQMIKMTLIR